MNETLSQVISALLPLLTVVVTALSTFLTYSLNQYIKKLKLKSDTQVTQSIIENVVAYVDQCLKEATNEAKLEEATKRANEWLQTKGIQVSDTELKILIESAVNAAHKTWLEEPKICERGEA